MGESGPKEGECHFYLSKKRRYCRFRPNSGQQYCPEHACIMGIQTGRKRIPCPLNPSHNCYEDELQKHVKKCNVTKIQAETQKACYFVKGINKGSNESETEKAGGKNVCVKDLMSADLASMIAKVNRLYADHVEKIETAIFEHPSVKEEFCNSEEEGLSGAFKDQAVLRKELLQQASLLGQLEKQKFLNGAHCFVEMGAGKGKLSHWIQKASKDSADNSFVLVERGSVRYKMDAFHKYSDRDSKFKRIKIDIGDLCLGRVPEVSCEGSVIVIGKHLCGGATDMGIRCAVETLGIQDDSHKGSTSDLSDRKRQTSSSSSSSCVPHSNDKTLASEVVSSEKLPQSLVNSGADLKIPQTSVFGCEQLSNEVDSHSLDVSSAATASSVDLSHSHSSIENVSHNEFHEEKSEKNVEADKTEMAAVKDDSMMDIGNKNNNRQETGTNKERDISQLSDDVQEPPPKSQKLMERDEKGEHSERHPQGIMIALCCHHQCTWDTYLGKEFMKSCNVSPREFDLLTRLTCWATCAKVTAKSVKKSRTDLKDTSCDKNSDSAKKEKPEDKDEKRNEGTNDKYEEHDTVDRMNFQGGQHLREQLSVAEREEIGRKCKRLIDTGRLNYLKSKGMECFLREYINEDITPENIVLMAYKSSP